MHVISAKQQRKFGQIDERKRRRGGRFETGGATFVLLTLPLSDPDFEAGGSMLNKEGSHVLASPLKGNNNLTIKL